MKQNNNSTTNLVNVRLINVFICLKIIISVSTAQTIFNPNTFCIGHNEDGNLQVYANGQNGIVYTRSQNKIIGLIGLLCLMTILQVLH
jgi:hypothetical protein